MCSVRQCAGPDFVSLPISRIHAVISVSWQNEDGHDRHSCYRRQVLDSTSRLANTVLAAAKPRAANPRTYSKAPVISTHSLPHIISHQPRAVSHTIIVHPSKPIFFRRGYT